jgi:hypothetical protein
MKLGEKATLDISRFVVPLPGQNYQMLTLSPLSDFGYGNR